MTRDVFYVFPTDVVTLYNAYAQAAAQPPFERECKCEPYHTLTFGINMSLKYNMNGGACILHFMPLPQGAAVDVHFVIAQVFGARYEAYAEELTRHAAAILGLAPQRVEMEVDTFMRSENKVTAAPVTAPTDVVTPNPAPVPMAPPPAPVGAPVPPVAPPPPPPMVAMCPRCGTVIHPDQRFCGGCGVPIAQPPAPKVCPACGSPAAPEAVFCMRCGGKL